MAHRIPGGTGQGGTATPKTYRADQEKSHKTQLERNRKIIYATQEICGICGKPVDFTIKYPDPMSPCIDHIIPINRGGHPSDMDNLQLAHWICNRQKSDRLPGEPARPYHTSHPTPPLPSPAAGSEEKNKNASKKDLDPFGDGLGWTLDWRGVTGA